MLTYIGEVSNSDMVMQLKVTTGIGNVVPAGYVASSELVSGDSIPHQ